MLYRVRLGLGGMGRVMCLPECVLTGHELLVAGLRIGEHLRHSRCQGRGAC